MLQIDRNDFGAALAGMYGAHGRNLTEHAATGWWDALKDLNDAGLVAAGIRELSRTSIKLPVPKEVRDWYNARVVRPESAYSYTQNSPNWPLASEVFIARRMSPAAVLADPLMGQRMADYIRAHPAPQEPAREAGGRMAEAVQRMLDKVR